MSMNTDQIIDRRRLRRKISFWRVAAFLLLIGLIIAIAGATGAFEQVSKRARDHIARVKITGVITDDRDMIKLFDTLSEKERVKAVILDISSPGGSTVGGEAMYEAIRKLGMEKPVVASVGTLAASAGYMIACASDYIVSRRTSLVGSIGVYVQYGDIVGLLDKVGVTIDAVKSSPLKAEPSPFNKASEEAKQMLARVVDDTYGWFLDLVAERRNLDKARARRLADGSIYTGAQGLENGLVDAIGDEETAKEWLVANKGVDDDLEIIEWKPNRDRGNALLNSLAADRIVARILGLPGDESATALRDFIEKRLFLDGLSSLMQTR